MKKNTDFGNYIQKLRKERHLTLKVVADKLEIDVSMLSKIEHGERQVNSVVLKKLAKIFDLDFRELQIQFLSKKILSAFQNEPFIINAMENCISSLSKKEIRSAVNQ